jgi:hypothetical protein
VAVYFHGLKRKNQPTIAIKSTDNILLSVAIREIRGFVFASGLTGYYAPKSGHFGKKFAPPIKRRVFDDWD